MDKKLFYSVLMGIFLVLGIFLVGAYNPGGQADPSVFGHSEEEIEGLLRSQVNSTLKSAVVMNKDLAPGASDIITVTGEQYPGCGAPPFIWCWFPFDAREVLVRVSVQNEFSDGSAILNFPISLSVSSDKLFLQVHNTGTSNLIGNGNINTQELFWFPVGSDKKVTFNAYNGAAVDNGDNVRFVVEFLAYRS